ncbi:hypothetical protein Zmor_003583 [Zophobas morio]|uniref:Uncharacterized protein n=1 Tax=Zophobas morio TaxID=2755281 RepID=A0AA38HSI1_9CUCU|nr:hypothetical protein Zmor_003583 [Zophobas morio]
MAVESFLDVRTALTGELTLLTVSTAERRAHKDSSGAVSKRRPGKSRSGIAMDVRERSRSENMGLNRGDRREGIHSASEDSQEHRNNFCTYSLQ